MVSGFTPFVTTLLFVAFGWWGPALLFTGYAVIGLIAALATQETWGATQRRRTDEAIARAHSKSDPTPPPLRPAHVRAHRQTCCGAVGSLLEWGAGDRLRRCVVVGWHPRLPGCKRRRSAGHGVAGEQQRRAPQPNATNGGVVTKGVKPETGGSGRPVKTDIGAGGK